MAKIWLIGAGSSVFARIGPTGCGKSTLLRMTAGLRVQMRVEIRALHERVGSTSIFVTHDQVKAMTMADRIVLNVRRAAGAGRRAVGIVR